MTSLNNVIVMSYSVRIACSPSS